MSEHEEWTVRPGSGEATERGCRCPVIDNAHGRGRGGDGDRFGWFINGDCPLHGSRVALPVMEASDDT